MANTLDVGSIIESWTQEETQSAAEMPLAVWSVGHWSGDPYIFELRTGIYHLGAQADSMEMLSVCGRHFYLVDDETAREVLRMRPVVPSSHDCLKGMPYPPRNEYPVRLQARRPSDRCSCQGPLCPDQAFPTR